MKLNSSYPKYQNQFITSKFPLDFEFNDREGVKKLVSTYSFRYELSKLFKPTSTISFGSGIGANPYFTKTEYEPTNPNAIYSNSKIFGFSLNLIPRINFKVSERIQLDLNIPFKLYDFRFEDVSNRNPAIPVRQQRNTNLSHVFAAPSFTMRFGVAFLL
jgi:hypothetical protein